MEEQNDDHASQEELERKVLLQDKEIVRLKEKQANYEAKISKLEQELANANTRLQQLLHERYGRKSEKIPDEMLPVLDEAVVTPEEAAVIADAEREISVAGHARGKPKRKPIPPEFERETIIHDLPIGQQVCSCGGTLHCIGEDTHEQLDYVPAKIKVIKHIRKKYGCRDCEIGVAVAPTPKDFIPKSLAAPGLLAHVILSKYEDHLPLYRQEKIWQRIGIDIARSTLCNWVLLAAAVLQILVDLLREELLRLDYARADETPVQVMEENKVRTSKRAYMWVFASGRKDKAIIVYKFAMTRAGYVAEEFFEGFKGFLQADGFTGYNNLCAKDGMVRVGCMTHARRKFAAIVKLTQKTGAAHYAVAVIAKLYRIEDEIKTQNLDFDDIRDYRQQHAKPILLEFKTWLEQKQKQAPPQGNLGKAIYYFVEHWDALIIYLEYGFLDIDNNFTEQRVKPFTIGRKNWLFMGNERGGEAAANFFSLIESAKANGLNTYAYFRYIMTELPLIDKSGTQALLAMLPHRIDPAILQKYLN
jgi:transposase